MNRVGRLVAILASLVLPHAGRAANELLPAPALPRLNFANDIVPLLSRLGCNASGCHGKAEGQNGFKLSVFGSDPLADYAALVMDSRGRRIFPAAPEQSLFLRKASGQAPHGGGSRLSPGSRAYQTLRDWVAAGYPLGSDADPHVTAIRVEPNERVLAMRSRQQLRVIARYSDGRQRDVTDLARFQSNNEALATVDEAGLVRAGDSPGDAAVMAGFMNEVDVFRVFIPRAETDQVQTPAPENNFIDHMVFKKLAQLHIAPSPLADDATFLRRVYLDIIGTLPTAAEAERFLGEPRGDRRTRLVDQLLSRPEFADYWALKWSDLLRVDRQVLGHKQAHRYYRWIRDSLAANKPFDQFARELVTAEGPLGEVGPASFFKVASKPGEAASTLTQVFLGVRIACAECHHHPYDRWSQNDYFGMQAFFAPLGVQSTPHGEALTATSTAEARHPRTGEVVPAHVLDGPALNTVAIADRRAHLARWMTSPDNPWFARSVANRVWAHFLGRGLVEPVDDFRATNPPTNPELLEALAKSFVDSGFDLRALMRTITSSRVYQLSSRPNASNERDEQNYSRALFRRIDAEVLLDMICQTTGVGEKFPGVPAGCRAIQLWDSRSTHYVLKLFGRPTRATACECERNSEPSVGQVLHLLNGPDIMSKLNRDSGYIARLAQRHKESESMVDELYLTYFARRPSPEERARSIAYLDRDPGKRRQALEDLAWTMLNSLEFLFNH